MDAKPPRHGIATGGSGRQISGAVSRFHLWPLRVLWLALPVLCGPCLTDALDGRSGPIRLVALVLAYAAWGVGLAASLVPHPLSLTALRTLAPATLAAAIWATLAGGDPSAADVLALVATAGVTALALSPLVGDVFVDGGSYGPERRMALRPSTALLAGPIELAWVVAVAGAVAGPLLLAAEQWVLGAVVLVVGWAATSVAVRSLHQLSRRWVVFVPTGLVLHDPLSTPEPHLFLRRSVQRIGPATVDDAAAADTLDLSQGAAGLVLELKLNESHDVLVSERRGQSRTVDTTRILFVPTRAAALLDEARERRLPVA